jgi:hypothetical protein
MSDCPFEILLLGCIWNVMKSGLEAEISGLVSRSYTIALVGWWTESDVKALFGRQPLCSLTNPSKTPVPELLQDAKKGGSGL